MNWEERWHPLREEWVIVAAHRQSRPWNGEIIEVKATELPDYVDDCYLCPGNLRVSGKTNDKYKSTFVFDNDHPCVSCDAPQSLSAPAGIYRNRPADGIARVVCYSPKHNVTLSELSEDQIAELLTVWQEQYRELGSHKNINHILFFENKGEVVGVSNPHPHCQIYATNFVFKTIENEARISQRHLIDTGRTLFQGIIDAEKKDERRIIYQNDSAIAFIPYFARYAYEAYLAPLKTYPSLAAMTENDVLGFAEVMKGLLVKYDNLWNKPFPYVMALHQAPTDGGSYDGFHFHIEFHPPLRQPHLLKYLAGPEIGGGNFLSDTSPEEKAAELRAASDIHYKDNL